MSTTSCAVLSDGDTQTLEEKYHYIFSGYFRLSSVFQVLSLPEAFGFCVTWEQKRLLFLFMTWMYGLAHKHTSPSYTCQPVIYLTIKMFHSQITGWHFSSFPVFHSEEQRCLRTCKETKKKVDIFDFLLWRREWFTKIQMCFFFPMKIQNL